MSYENPRVSRKLSRLGQSNQSLFSVRVGFENVYVIRVIERERIDAKKKNRIEGRSRSA